MYLIFLGCFAHKLLIKNEKARPGLWIFVNIFVAAVTIEKFCEVSYCCMEKIVELPHNSDLHIFSLEIRGGA